MLLQRAGACFRLLGLLPCVGELVEFGRTDELFIKPEKKHTEDCITDRLG